MGRGKGAGAIKRMDQTPSTAANPIRDKSVAALGSRGERKGRRRAIMVPKILIFSVNLQRLWKNRGFAVESSLLGSDPERGLTPKLGL
jgi:hypothetical protein